MPDPGFLALSAGVAAIVAAVVLALCGLPWHMPPPRRTAVGWLLAVSAGFSIGCWLLHVAPRWPLAEDRDRLLAVVLPGVLLVELLSAAGLPSWLAWILRLIIAGAAAPVLLHGSVYLASGETGDALAWSTAGRCGRLLLLAAILASVWAALRLVEQRRPSRALPFSLGLTCCGAGLVIMLSGYASGGQLGLILGGALVGAVVGSWPLRDAARAPGVIGLGAVGLFSLLLVGHYFGSLTAGHAAVLFAAPLANLLPVARWTGRCGAWATAAATVLLVLLPVAIVLVQAGNRFRDNSQRPSPSGATRASDYSDFGS